MGVKPNKYKSAVEALTKRVLKGQNIWNISSVVDGYNCVSVRQGLDMLSEHLNKIGCTPKSSGIVGE